MNRAEQLRADHQRVVRVIRHWAAHWRCALREPEIAAAGRLEEVRVWAAVDYGVREGLLARNAAGEVVQTEVAVLGEAIAELEVKASGS